MSKAYEIDPVYGTKLLKTFRPPSQIAAQFHHWMNEIRDIYSDLLSYPTRLLTGSHTTLYVQSYKLAQRALLRCYAQFCDFSEHPALPMGNKVLMYAELNSLQYSMDCCQSDYLRDEWDFYDPYVEDSYFPF